MTEQETANKTNYEYSQQPSEEDSAGSGGRSWLVAAIVIVILITALIIVMVFANSETIEKAKNIAIVVSAAASLILIGSVFVLVYQLSALTGLLRTELRPILNTTKETVKNVKGTVTFMSDKVVSPAISVGSKVAGIKKIGSLLFHRK